MKLAALFLMLLPPLAPRIAAQTLTVYSEFVHLDDAGVVTAPAEPREILSPAVARNAFTSFQIVVRPTDATPWQLYVAQNPENAVTVTLYREFGGRLIKQDQPPAGTGPAVFWMDIWTARAAPVQRIKVEPQLNYHSDWVIYPMEARVMELQVDNAPANGWPVGTADPMAVIGSAICQRPLNNGAAPKDPTPASLRFRNAQQDKAVVARASLSALMGRYGSCEAAPAAEDVESYYRIRDYLFRLP